jgi:ribonuclease R
MSSLTDDYYEFIEDRYCLAGTHNGHTYRLGDTVQIEVLQVNLEERSIDFIMAGENDAMQDYLKTQLNSSREGRRNKRRHGSHEQVNGVMRPYAKRGKGGIGGNKYAGSFNKKKRRRR